MESVYWLLGAAAIIGLLLITTLFAASRYRRCPSDKVLVVYGKVGAGQASRCIHGGGALVWPLIQDYAYLGLTPMAISIPLQKALSLQNIRINVPSTFTVGVSTEPEIMNAAAERLLHLGPNQIEDMAKEIILGQLRLTVASLTIEQINQDRESFMESIRKNVAGELSKIGLYLINVNITDITDESGYIDSIGKKAASEAINQAKIDVAEQDKKGAIGEAEATREKEIRVAQNVAEAQKGKKEAEASQRIFVQQQEAQAVEGENTAKAQIAKVNAELAREQAAAAQTAQVAEAEAEKKIQEARAAAETARLKAEQVVQQQIEKEKIEIAAEAQAEKSRREAKGEADAIQLMYQAEAEGIRKVLDAKAAGYLELVKGCGGDAKAAATLLMTEKIEEVAKLQVEAIRNIKFDKVTVWDGGSAQGGPGATANFLSGLVKSLPPLHEVAAMAGISLPKYLGEIEVGDPQGRTAAPETPEQD